MKIEDLNITKVHFSQYLFLRSLSYKRIIFPKPA